MSNQCENKIKDLIERLENYPTCMSCYLKSEESIAATELKNKFIQIIKEELEVLNKENNPAFETAEARFFVAIKDGEIVGRVAAIINWFEVKEQKIKKMRNPQNRETQEQKQIPDDEFFASNSMRCSTLKFKMFFWNPKV